jgi:GH25 family lysozyme M1 (1,4-beta-N-acetylmuramidase)
VTLGIDVSRWQGVIGWSQVAAAGVRYAWINASNQDPGPHYRGALAAGVIPGLYWRLPADVDPAAAARQLSTAVNALKASGPGTLPPCLDLEDGTGNQAPRAQRFLAELRTRTGARRVAVYSGAWFFQNLIGEAWADPDVVLWIADYGSPVGRPRYLSPRVAVHQHSATGQIPGINGNVDLNHALWPLDRLTGRTGAAVPPVAVRPPEFPDDDDP